MRNIRTYITGPTANTSKQISPKPFPLHSLLLHAQYFGEVSLLLGIRRTASARTKTQCLLYKISKERLLAVLQDFPEMAERMRKVAESRVSRLEHYLDPKNKPLRREDEIDAEDSKTDLFGADADVVARDKAEEFEAERRQNYRGAPPTGINSAGGRTTGFYSTIRRRAHQGGGGRGRNNRLVLPLAHRGPR